MNKKILIPSLIAVFLLVIGGVYFLSSQNSAQKKVNTTPIVDEEVIPTIVPSNLGLTMTLRSDKKAVKFEIKKSKDISLVEYQISYTKEINGEQVPEGLIGEVKPKDDGSISIDYREFGTCSRNVCRYDKVISEVKLTLKITKTDGKVYSSEDTIEL